MNRRQFSIFGFSILLASRWPFLVRAQKSKPLTYDELLHLFQTDPSRVMMKNEGKDIRIFTNPNAGYRVEYLDVHKVVIGDKRSKKTIFLDLNKRTYRERPLQPLISGKAEITYSISHPSDSELYNEIHNAKPLPLLEFDPKLFEIPAGFTKAE